MVMKSRHVGIRELREQSALYVKRAEAGEELLISVHGKPAATLGPVRASTPTLTMSELSATFALISPRRRGVFSLRAPFTINSGTRIDQALREVRG
jgi:prevent-host-death family protein